MKNLTLTFLLIAMIFFSKNTEAQDWPNLERFRAENQQLDKPAKKENRVVFMGNSITEGWSQHHPEFFKDKTYINRGISGQTTPQMLIRFRPDVIDLEPKVVVILAGINDIAGNTGPSTLKMIADNIKSMAELAKANKIKVVLCSVLPANDFPWNPGTEPADKVIELNQMIKTYAESNKIIYVDYFSQMVDDQKGLKSELTYDGVHPTKAGYQVMEPLVEAAIKKAL
nr:SGNH/GDSL hydrolase family protein [uncultured Carboxylicivirga sp.]